MYKSVVQHPGVRQGSVVFLLVMDPVPFECYLNVCCPCLGAFSHADNTRTLSNNVAGLQDPMLRTSQIKVKRSTLISNCVKLAVI